MGPSEGNARALQNHSQRTSAIHAIRRRLFPEGIAESLWAIEKLQNGAPSAGNRERPRAACRYGILEMLDDAVPGMWKGNHCVLVTPQARRSVIAMRK